MAASALVDTGVILAFLDRDDEWHQACVESFRLASFPLLTTEAVMTEVFHLAIRDFGRIEPAWELFNSASITLASLTDADLPDIRTLMSQYDDHPMDFADATLVHVANRESISLILTIDHNDFETYRLAGNKKFTVRPNRNAKKG
jgi:predicted nucleic acid-binding protein